MAWTLCDLANTNHPSDERAAFLPVMDELNMRVISSLAVVLVAVTLSTQNATAATTVAIFDAGVNSFDGLVYAGGFDHVNGDSTPQDDSDTNHGTAIAAVISSIAPGTPLLIEKVWGPSSRHFASRDNAAMLRVLDRPEVRVVDINRLSKVDPALLQQAVAQDKVIVINVGNTGGGNPVGAAQHAAGLGGAAVVGVGLDESGEILTQSNRAGNLRDIALSAPGFNSVSSSRGSSFSKPHISAAAALVINRWPFLSAPDVVSILLNTADDLGAPGVDSVYGHGRVNPAAAIGPSGEMLVPTGDSGGGGSSAGGALVVAGAVAAAIIVKNRTKQKNTILVDSYGRGFEISLEDLISVRDDSNGLRSRLAGLDDESYIARLTADGSTMAYVSKVTSTAQRLDEDDLFADRVEEISEYSIALSGDTRNGGRYLLGYNASPRLEFGATAQLDRSFDAVPFTASHALSAPYFGYSDQGVSAQFKYQLGRHLDLKFGAASTDEAEEFGLNSDGVLMEGVYHKDHFALGLQIGYLNETGSLFGGASNGAFSVDATSTLSLGLSTVYRSSERITWFANYSEGYSKVNHRTRSQLQNFTALRSNTFGAGVVASDVLRQNDRLGFTVSQPLRIASGHVDFSNPYTQRDDGKILFDDERINLNPDVAETAFEIFYGHQTRHDATVSLLLVHRDNPSHIAHRTDINALLATYQRDF